MKTAVAQLVISPDKHQNLGRILSFISKAKAESADLVIFPEIAMATVPKNSPVKHADIAEPLDGPFVSALANAARQHKIHVVCGLYESQPGESTRAYNTVILLDDEGKCLHHYRKTHLYDAFSYRESENIIPGDSKLKPVSTRLGTMGILVCYELRFPEISRTLALQGADLLVVPTAWLSGPMKEEHLLTLAHARAVENTVFVCIADQVGHPYAGRSTIYNPMGVVMASRGEDEGLIFAEINLDQLQTIREKNPCLLQRHPQLYKLH